MSDDLPGVGCWGTCPTCGQYGALREHALRHRGFEEVTVGPTISFEDAERSNRDAIAGRLREVEESAEAERARRRMELEQRIAGWEAARKRRRAEWEERQRRRVAKRVADDAHARAVRCAHDPRDCGSGYPAAPSRDAFVGCGAGVIDGVAIDLDDTPPSEWDEIPVDRNHLRCPS